MAKFSLEFKKEVSEKYLEDELSLKSVARMYGISPGFVALAQASQQTLRC